MTRSATELNHSSSPPSPASHQTHPALPDSFGFVQTGSLPGSFKASPLRWRGDPIPAPRRTPRRWSWRAAHRCGLHSSSSSSFSPSSALPCPLLSHHIMTLSKYLVLGAVKSFLFSNMNGNDRREARPFHQHTPGRCESGIALAEQGSETTEFAPKLMNATHQF